jgi:WS/DGAT/MGAT family acyltransferase
MLGAEEWLADAVIRPLTDFTVKALQMAGDSAARSVDFWLDPQKGMEHGLQGSADVARLALHVAQDMAALALMPDDSPTRLKGTPGHSKRVAWCAPLPLDNVKAVGKALGCSINDVLLSCVAGAIGAYLRAKGEATLGKEIRAMVPVNLRPLHEAYKLGNHFGLVPVVLPIGLDNPLQRLWEVRQRMRALKGSTQPVLAYGVLAVAGLLVKPAQDALLGLFSRKTTAVMTNVPGPREKQAVCGATIEESMFWVPQTGTVGLGVSILSYGGGVQFGVVSDAGLCPDPQAIIDRFAPEFDTLTTLTLMLPWGE